MIEPFVRRRIDAAPTRPKRGDVEYRVIWKRQGMMKPKSRLFQVLDSAEQFAFFLKSTEGKRRVLPGYEGFPEMLDEPMLPLEMLRIDYRATGGWRNPEWDGWQAPRVPKVGA
jgi:hypothetical protein